MKWTKKTAFINRFEELNFLNRWASQQPENVLFLFGPKSSGKTTLINHFMGTFLNVGEWDVKHFKLREILITNYTDFLQTFFEMDYSKGKEELREKREYNLKVFKLAVETLKGLRNKELDPFVVMKRELLKLTEREIKPLIVIDELQALEGVYMDGQRELIQELFNFFVAITKESHLCHVLICSSDGYFIERIYSDSKLTKACRMHEVDYLRKDDVVHWLNHLKEESGIDNLILTPTQIEMIWHYFGGSVWEISNFLSTLMIGADHNGVEDSFLEDEANKEVLAWKNRFQDYLGKSVIIGSHERYQI